MLQRIIGFIKLDVPTIESVEHDESATAQAGIVVAIVAVLSAIGAFLGAGTANSIMDTIGKQLGESGTELPIAIPTISPIGAALTALIGAFVTWLLWSAITYFVGTKMFGGKATMGEMMRVLGFAQGVQLLRVFSFIPCLGFIISLAVGIWGLVVGFVSVRQGLDLDNGKAAMTIGISWIAAIIVNLVVIGPILGLLF